MKNITLNISRKIPMMMIDALRIRDRVTRDFRQKYSRRMTVNELEAIKSTIIKHE